jgi:lysophospholipase L1-like esterase
MRVLWFGVCLATALGLAACGGGGGSAGPSPVATPTPVQGPTVQAVVFYDEDGDGQRGAREPIRVPDVEIVIAGRSAKSERNTGLARVQGVPEGTHTVEIRGGTLPPFYQAGRLPSVAVPAGGASVDVPLTLPIGTNTPNVYMAFGDSLTRGLGSTAGGDYPAQLQVLLGGYFAGAVVTNRGADATNTYEALERFRRNFRGQQPAYVLILYGTNDWNVPECQDKAPCFTVDNLREVVNLVKDANSLPVLGLIPPVNPAINAGRNSWVQDINRYIRAMGEEEGAAIADTYAAFNGKGGDLSRFFIDHVHFNDAGYKVIAEAFFAGIAGRGVTAASTGGLGWKPGGGAW